LQGLDEEIASPTFWDDPKRAREKVAQANIHKSVLRPLNALSSMADDLGVMFEFLSEESDPKARESAIAEIEDALVKAEAAGAKLEMQSLLNGKFDGNNAYVTIHAGAGGTESCDWADMLYRMYSRYCESAGFECEMMDYQAGEEAGIRGLTMLVKGEWAFGYFRAERGIHRLVRISPFDANKRRHTSFASLDVLAEIGEADEAPIDETQLRIDTFRSSGKGGQHVNTTDSAVRVTHIPTGLFVACQAERSQHKNKSKAMKMLAAKLYELEQDKKRKDLERFYGPKGDIAWGSQIRSYVVQPYTLVKDHRSGHETGNINAVFDGAIQPFIEAYLKSAAMKEMNKGGSE
jgi:peptide chain release factor 2